MDSQNYWNGIERRKPNGELETLVAQQAAVIEQMRLQFWSFATGKDHEDDAHKYGSECVVCEPE